MYKIQVCVSNSKEVCFADMSSDSEEGSHLRLIELVYHSILGWRVIEKRKRMSI